MRIPDQAEAVSFEGGLVGIPEAWNAGCPEGSVGPLEEERAVDLPALWIRGIDGSALGFEQRMDVRFHGGSQTQPSHERVELLDDAVGIWAVEMLDGKGDLHFAVGGFDAPAFAITGDNGLRRNCGGIQE